MVLILLRKPLMRPRFNIVAVYNVEEFYLKLF